MSDVSPEKPGGWTKKSLGLVLIFSPFLLVGFGVVAGIGALSGNRHLADFGMVAVGAVLVADVLALVACFFVLWGRRVAGDEPGRGWPLWVRVVVWTPDRKKCQRWLAVLLLLWAWLGLLSGLHLVSEWSNWNLLIALGSLSFVAVLAAWTWRARTWLDRNGAWHT